MEPTIETHTASDGYVLHYRRWAPDGPPRARVVYLHGIQSHGGWYEASCRALFKAGCEVFFLDRRGSGLNEAERGHAESWQQLVDDVAGFMETLQHQRAEAPSSHEATTTGPRHAAERGLAAVPVILLAVSWGGKLAAVVGARHGELLDGLGLLYPAIAARVRPRWYQVLLLRAACRLGWGRRRVAIPLNDPALFTATPRWQQFLVDDPLSQRQASLSLLRASHDLDRLVKGTAEQLRLPTLMMLAGRDQIIDNRAARAYFEHLAATAKRLVEYPEAAHTLEFEDPPDVFLADLVQWVGTITPASDEERA